jgi:protocatechuate 3,4-dioxygenase beta subunit
MKKSQFLFSTLALFLSGFLLTACSSLQSPGPNMKNAELTQDTEPVPFRDEIVSLTEDNPDCVPGKTTPEVTEGPYYKEGSPEEKELFMEGMTGQKVLISGIVYNTNCEPIAKAWVDIWQADSQGEYDNSGYTLRGHTYTDASGRYTIETEVPGIYSGRTAHIHAKASAREGGKVLTTQLFFPGVKENNSDDIYRDDLLIKLDTSTTPWQGTFHFVVNE